MALRYDFACLLPVLVIISAFGLTPGLSLSGQLSSSKKLLSYPTLVSILKAKNATRPISALSQPMERVQQQASLPETDPLTAMKTPPLLPSIATALSVSASKHDNICSPASKETNVQIAKLCDVSGDATVEGEEDDVSRGSCLQRFCVTLIPEARAKELVDHDDLESEQGNNEIVAYTDCGGVKNLFKLLVRSSVIPKCFDCSK